MNIAYSVILVMLSICMLLNTFLLYRNQKKINELVEIRNELQDIKIILEYRFLPKYTIEHEMIDGKRVRKCHNLEAPLEDLRKYGHILPQHQND